MWPRSPKHVEREIQSFGALVPSARLLVQASQVLAQRFHDLYIHSDVEFDLEEDREKCLHGLDTKQTDRSDPSDVQRITQVFRDPEFFVDGASSTDVVQGALGNCWFLSGAAAVATMPELVENFCVARDEQVGVYGFMFQRNGIWTDVIVRTLFGSFY